MAAVVDVCPCTPEVNYRRALIRCKYSKMRCHFRFLTRIHIFIQCLLIIGIYSIIHVTHFHSAVDHNNMPCHRDIYKRSNTLAGSALMSSIDQNFLTANEVLKSTAIGVKTFNRPECLTEFITSVRTFAPYLTIFVIDDSDQDARTLFLRGADQGDVYVMLPTDSGTGYGRNRIVQAISKAGYDYLIMADDDFKLTAPDTIPMLAKYLVETNADIVAATRCDHDMDNCKRNKGMIVVDEHRNLTIVPNVTMYPQYEQAPTCFRSDLVQQFFMARTKTLSKVHWDDRLKNNDHYDFLFAAKRNGLSLVTCQDVQVLHKKTCEALSIHGDQYKTTREKRWYDLLEYIMNKWSLLRIYDEVGKVVSISNNGTGVGDMGETFKYATNSEESRYLLSSVADYMNGYQPGWNWIRPHFDKSWVIRKQFGPCIHLLSGLMQYDFDRYRTFNNKVSSTKFSQFIYNETCSFAEHFWEVKDHGSIDDGAHVYYVTAIADDSHYLQRLLNNLDADTQRHLITLIIVVMDNISGPIIQRSKQMVGFNVVIVDAGPPFSRSIGLKIGFQKALELANKRREYNAIGFSVDTSIIMPADFSTRIRQSTQCGLSAFSPVVYKCVSCINGDLHNRTDGYWVYSGFGMMGFCLDDYVRVGGWGTAWGYHWGGEDVDILERTVKHLPFVYRAKEEGYIYVRDPALKQRNPNYYTGKNIFPHTLPPTSLTSKINNPTLGQRLIKFAKRAIPALEKEEFVVDEFSRSYTEDSKGALYYIVVSNRHRENDRRWFLVHSYLSPILPS